MAERVDNPYLELWKARQSRLPANAAETARALIARDKALFARIKAARNEFTHKYSYAIPTLDALLTIREFSPLIEIGAGTGYWAWLLRQLNTDIIAYDSNPPTPESDENRFHVRSACWTEVLQGDERELDNHPHRTLLLCWPPANNPMATQTLRRYRGRTFLYVGEPPLADGFMSSTGDEEFVELLHEQWAVVRTVSLPNWELCWDGLFVFRRVLPAGIAL